MNDKPRLAIELPADRDDFLEWAASVDDGFLSVGGLAARCGLIGARLGVGPDHPRVFGQLIEFARREAGLSIEALADRADVDLSELVAIERHNADPTPRTVHQLSATLDLPLGKLRELAGLVELRDPRLNMAAVRFAARSEPRSQLNPHERDAFEEFVKALAETTD